MLNLAMQCYKQNRGFHRILATSLKILWVIICFMVIILCTCIWRGYKYWYRLFPYLHVVKGTFNPQCFKAGCKIMPILLLDTYYSKAEASVQILFGTTKLQEARITYKADVPDPPAEVFCIFVLLRVFRTLSFASLTSRSNHGNSNSLQNQVCEHHTKDHYWAVHMYTCMD